MIEVTTPPRRPLTKPLLFSCVLLSILACVSEDSGLGESPEELRQRPVAKAGPDQTVDGGATVALDGSASTGGAQAGALSYQWLQLSGTSVTLSNANGATTTFVAPTVAGTLTFKLTVSNNRGSASDTVNVTVTSPCTPTTCEAQGKDCGGLADGCGGILDCGGCTSPQACGGGGVANVCGTGPSGTVGPTEPVGPVATTCSGVALSPGASLQTAVNNYPTGTTFCLAAGTYAQQHVVPKAGNKFIGAVGAILDGQNQTERAFDGSAANVVIQNLVIQNYTAGSQNAPLYLVNSTGWQVLHNEIRYNAGMGISVRDRALVQFNNIHHNLQEGYGSDGGVGIVYDSNEIAFNNYTDAFDPGWEAGGGKLWDTQGAQMTHNYSHDNHGPGLWDDYDNIDITYAYNRIENNWDAGIHHEISYNASIHDNVIIGNGKRTGSACNWLWCAGISIAGSGGVNGGMIEIYNNTVTPGSSTGNAIALIQQDRGSGAYGPWLVQNVWVHDNIVDLSRGGHQGAVQDLGSNAIFTSRNNRFDRNTYTLGTTTGALWWNNAEGGKSFWQGFGLDLNGVFH